MTGELTKQINKTKAKTHRQGLGHIELPAPVIKVEAPEVNVEVASPIVEVDATEFSRAINAMATSVTGALHEMAKTIAVQNGRIETLIEENKKLVKTLANVKPTLVTSPRPKEFDVEFVKQGRETVGMRIIAEQSH